MKNLLYILLLSLSILQSCELEKDINYKTYAYTPQVIVHAYISPQDGAIATVKKMLSPGQQNKSEIIAGAKVFIYNSKGDTLLLKQRTDIEFYSDSLLFFNTNERYSITVKSDNYQDLTSNDQRVYSSPIIDSLYITSQTRSRLTYRMLWQSNSSQEFAFYKDAVIYINGITDLSYSAAHERFNPFSVDLEISNEQNTSEEIIHSFNGFDSVRINQYILSPDLKKFLKSQMDYDTSNGDPFYPKPAPVFSNIKGGQGIFASYSYSTKMLIIEKEEIE